MARSESPRLPLDLRARLLRPLAPKVLPDTLPQVTCESGSPEAVASTRRFAVVAHYGPSPTISRSLRTMVREFSVNGYQPVVVSACPAETPLDWSDELPEEAVVLRKPNVGYDFGSWAVAMAMIPAIKSAEYVILANDSVLGPFNTLRPLLDKFEGSHAEMWGLTDSHQFRHHVQSYFLGFRKGVLSRDPLDSFWANIRHERTRTNVIRRNELGLTPLVVKHNHTWEVAFPARDLVLDSQNPVLHGWRRLLDKGFPFVKREVLWNPAMAPGSERIAELLMDKFGIALEDWQ